MTTSPASELQQKPSRRHGRPRRGFERRATSISLPPEIDSVVRAEALAVGRPVTAVIVAALARAWSDRLGTEVIEKYAVKPRLERRRVNAAALDALCCSDQKENEIEAAKAA